MKTRLVVFLILLSILCMPSCDINQGPTYDATPSESDSATTNDPYPVPSSETSEIPSTPTRRTEAFPGLPVLHGINLGNALEAPWPGAWGVTLTEDLIQSIAEAGFNAIRVPVRLSVYTGPAPDYLLSDTILENLDRVIQWGVNADLVILLDLHHFNAFMQSPESESARFLAIWEQLSVRYQSFPAMLYFELLNEPSGVLDSDTWNRLATQCITLIRQNNPTRTIVIGGVDYSGIEMLETLELPDDPHLAATFHYYEPFEFTHQGASWVEGSLHWIGTTWHGTSSEVSEIQQAFDRAVEWSNANRIPLILGEFGAIENTDVDSRLAWSAFVKQTAEARGIGWFYWDLCTNFGIFDCEGGKWDEGMMDIIITK